MYERNIVIITYVIMNDNLKINNNLYIYSYCIKAEFIDNICHLSIAVSPLQTAGESYKCSPNFLIF